MQLVTANNLACPLCAEPLTQMEHRLACANNHSFDRARQGYVNLLPVQHKKSRDPGDSKSMVAARRAFLNAGLYEPIAEELVKRSQATRPVTANVHQCIVDAGCGEGYYLDFFIGTLEEKYDSGATVSAIGLDISKDAIIAASRRNSLVSWIVGTNVHPPIMPNTVDYLLCLFGFPSFGHFRTLLKDDGIIVLVDPGPDHLIELRELIYPEVRRSPPPELSAAVKHGLSLKASSTLRYRTGGLDKSQIQHLLAMTPHLYRASYEGKLAAANLEKIEVTVEVAIRILEKEGEIQKRNDRS